MRKIIKSLLLILTSTALWAQTTISLDDVKNKYNLGDQVHVNLNIDTLEEFNNIYFDIEYNSDVLDWVEYRTTDVSSSDDSKVLFAKTQSKDNLTGRVLFSLLWNENQKFYGKTDVLTLTFKVRKNIESSSFLFRNAGLNGVNQDGTSKSITADWKDSENFRVPQLLENTFIWINNPMDNSVVQSSKSSAESINVSVISTKNTGYKIKLENETIGYTSDRLYDASLGYVENIKMFLGKGANIITAKLLNQDGTTIAIDSSTIHCKVDTNILEILSPDQHSVISKNKITVQAASKVEDVKINEVKAEYIGFNSPNNADAKVYYRDVWLKPGFNTIYVQATAPNNEVYKEELTVYYEKRDEVFRLLTPKNGDIVKVSKDLKLNFTGEINQKFSDGGIENKVTYDVLFYPLQYSTEPESIVSDGEAVIDEFTDADIDSECAYKFTNKNPIDLAKLGPGTIEITAYKNRQGSEEEDISKAYLYLDDSKLSIILDQPRVYAQDEISNIGVLNKFHDYTTGKSKELLNVEINANSDFILKESRNNITKSSPILWNGPRKGLVELEDGSMVYYSNINNIARFSTRTVQDRDNDRPWSDLISDTEKFFVYDVKETKKGLLLGVSNYALNGNTGLYLLKDKKLTNIVIGKPITHVQFIRLIKDTVYLYANNYSHIYSFNINDLEPYGAKLKVDQVKSYPLKNSLDIKDFQVSPTLKTVAILTNSGELLFYENSNNSFIKKEFVNNEKYKNVKNVYLGVYEKGAYNSWLVIGNSTINTVMEKKSDGTLIECTDILNVPGGNLIGAAFKDDNFYLLNNNGLQSTITKGKFFFNRFMPETVENYTYIENLVMSESDLVVTNYNGFYWGNYENLYNFTSDLQDSGYAKFSYNNPDIDYVNGFSFNIPGSWINSDKLSFDFSFNGKYESAGYSNQLEILSIEAWNQKYKDSNDFKSTLSYNNKTQEYKLEVDFLDNKESGDLDFIFRFNSMGTSSPSISNLNVKKKIPVKLPKIDSSSAYLSITGRVTDPTVKKIDINLLSDKTNDTEIILDSTGSFKYESVINTVGLTNTVKLTCSNSVEEIEEVFNINFFDSENGLTETKFYSNINDINPAVFGVDNRYEQSTDTIYLSTNFYGLIGSVLGYELLSLDESVILKQGLLTTNSTENKKDNKVTGSVNQQPIELLPGNQKVRVFVENPGGKRDYFYLNKENKTLPVVIYKIATDKERIKLTSNGVIEIASGKYSKVENCDVLQELPVVIKESTANVNPVYFSKEMTLSGIVESQHQLPQIKVRSLNPEITFGQTKESEVIIDIDEINRFNLKLNINVPENSDPSEKYLIILEPLAPYLINLKSVIKIDVQKDFKDANIIPDFSMMTGSRWAGKEIENLSKELNVKFTRELPVNTRLKLVVNFNKEIDGQLKRDGNFLERYILVDEFDIPINLNGVKLGVNRLRWELYYNENVVISSSTMKKPGMEDFIFELSGTSSTVATRITYPYSDGVYYNDATLSDILYVKDPRTVLNHIINNKVVQVVKDESSNGNISISPSYLRQGENDVVIRSDYLTESSTYENYSLFYDTLPPVVGKEVVTVDPITNSINTISVIINEANIKFVKLFRIKNAIKDILTQDGVITPLTNGHFKVEWNLEGFVPRINPHNNIATLVVEVEDKSGKVSSGTEFMGPKVVNSQVFSGVKTFTPDNDVMTNDNYYGNSPLADYRKGAEGYANNWVFFDSNPRITADGFVNKNSTDLLGDFTIERSGTVNIKGLTMQNGTTSPVVINNSKNSKVIFENGFSVPLGRKVVINSNKDVKEAPKPETILDKNYNEFSINGAIRFEENPAFFNDEPESIKKIISLDSAEDEEYYIGYKRAVNGSDIDLYLVFGPPLNSQKYLLKSNIPSDVWHNILINISVAGNFIKLYLNDDAPVKVDYTNDQHLLPNKILYANTKVFLGDRDDTKNGHYTLSQVFYTDTLIEASSISSYYTHIDNSLKLPANNPDYTYKFTTVNGSAVEAGSLPHHLRVDTALISVNEDADYSAQGSALIGTRNHRNSLEIKNGNIVFVDNSVPRIDGLTASKGNDFFTLQLNNGESSGKYYFGNSSPHGLSTDKYYSLSGSIEKLVSDPNSNNIDADFVLIFNGNEKRYKLTEGDFHFTYENPGRAVPYNVVLYVETSEDIRISNDIQLIEGNSVLSEELLENRSSYASTKYFFNDSGTIEFSYKPFNINYLGYVDYETILFSSDYVKVFTENSNGKYCYSANVGDIRLKSSVPVTEGWTDIMVTYSKELGAARLYVNGEVADYKEGAITLPSTPFNNTDDNVFIGGEPNNRYAEGYIDNLNISNFYNNPQNTVSTDKLRLVYSDTPKVALNVLSSQQSGVSWKTSVYSLSSNTEISAPLMKAFTGANNGECDLTDAIAPGQYFARLSGLINGKRVSRQIRFIRDDRPCFNIANAPKLLIPNASQTLSFDIEFDNSFLTTNNSNKYAGFVLQLSNKDGSQTESIYLCQDFERVDKSKWLYKFKDDTAWTPIVVTDNAVSLDFVNQIWGDNVYYNSDTFYFNPGVEPSNKILPVSSDIIPVASIEKIEKVKKSVTDANNNIIEFEYMLNVVLAGGSNSQNFSNVNDFSIRYSIDGFNEKVTVPFAGSGNIELYYDDILKGKDYGNYKAEVELIYKGDSFQTERVDIIWKEFDYDKIQTAKSNSLEIKSFDLINTKENSATQSYKGDFYLSLEHMYSDLDSSVALYYVVRVYSKLDNNKVKLVKEYNRESIVGSFAIIDNIDLPAGSSRIDIEVFEEIITQNGQVTTTSIGLTDHSETDINISVDAPEVFFTNSVPFYAAYNNMTFTWDGTVSGKNNNEILYSYNFNNQGWSAEVPEGKSLELYNLDEGFHELLVKAIYNKKESTIAKSRFFVDITEPVIDSIKITKELLFKGNALTKDYELADSVRFVGQKGAVTDSSLTIFYINNKEVTVNNDGDFTSDIFPIEYEGSNSFTFTAYDKVGNKTETTEIVKNDFIEIISPAKNRVQYAPFTLVGKISDKITQDVKIYIQDPLHSDIWHEGQVNSDRVFFINDISVNPGSDSRDSQTSFRLKIELGLGAVYYKDITINAGNLYRPLIVTLSKQATQGAGQPVEITISAECKIKNIASWSIDFDGDGIYDDIDVTDSIEENIKTWTHSYSTLGEISPRVRVITRDGEYFSQKESLIIHDQIKSASSTQVLKPIGMSIVHMPDSSERVFVLRGDKVDPNVDVFLIERNQSFIQSKLFTIDLKQLINGEKPTNILTLSNNSFVVTTESDESNRPKGTIHHFVMNPFGNYVPVIRHVLEGYISSITKSDQNLIITQKNNSNITKFSRNMDDIDFTTPETKELMVPLGNRPLPPGTPVTFLNGSIYAADKEYQRIIEYTENIEPVSYWGNYGTNDREFIQPNLLAGYASRLFISDTSRQDIQVFNSDDRVVTSLNSTGDYLEPDFFADLISIDSLGREEGGRLYYYVVGLSRSTEKLSMIKLPQWEEMRAKTRNNKIVFLKDKEVYTAKPNGSDLKKVLSTDSLPRIEGVVDYPTLSPDGRRLTFVSRKSIYTGGNENHSEDTWAYDNLYIMNIGDDRPVKVPLTGIENYEIERPVFNSNGDSIAFSARKAGGYWQIYEYNWNDGTISKLFDSIENLRFPYYSPDDRYLVYSTDYDGDQDLEIYDKENPDVRVEVTSNNFRDSFPVWTRVYPYEISNPESKIESKIAFVSDRNFKKGIHYVYIAKPSINDIRVVTKADKDVGNNPDSAAIEVTETLNEGDYPAFTGDGINVVFEDYDGSRQKLANYDFKTSTTSLMNLPEGSKKPSGMKNTITGFSAELINGNDVKLKWNPYTDHKIIYWLEFKKDAKDENFTRKKISSQNGTTVSGLTMNTDYLMRVLIEENAEKVAETRWIKVEIPEVVAKPSYTVDENNPYLINLHAWKPENDPKWTFSWIIDNQEITTANTAQVIPYHFATSGIKTIQLKATNANGDYSSISDSFTVNIISDIEPIIESTLITGGSNYLELDATNSRGNRINMSSAVWTITGPGQITPQVITGSKPIVDVSHIKHKVNVNLKLSRQMVNGQQETDILEVNKVIDLDYTDVKPIVTYEASQENPRLILFDGSRSLGNIDWRTARWSVYSDGELKHREDGVSNFSYLFKESSRPVPYAVSLTIADAGTGLTKTTSQTVSVDPASIEPVIDYEILTLKDNGQDVGVKVVLTATSSRGNNIDFNSTEWNLPLAAQHGEQPKQKGPTAIFNLRNPGKLSQVEVTITLMRQGGTDPVTKTELIQIDSTGISETEIFVNKEIEKTSEGQTIILDVLDSRGTDIDWKSTEWLVNGQYSFKGPVARIDREYMGEDQSFSYTVVLYRFGGDPITHTGLIPLRQYRIKPVISIMDESETNQTRRLTVKDTEGLNIDWTRTVWSIWDGNEDVVQKRGATILHTFVPKDKMLGYPVMVEMYLKNDDTPFYGYESIDIAADELNPIIQWDEEIDVYGADEGDSQVVSFSALSTTGSNIDWSQTKWNFGDGSNPAYGATVQHKYPISQTEKKYKVALTITRQSRTGSKESKTVYREINIGADEIIPVITAKIDRTSNTLVLSAEASEGRGLLLDRTVWMFAGKGDSQSFSRSKGEVNSNSNSQSVTAGGSIQFEGPVDTTIIRTELSGTLGSSSGTQNSDENNQSYSTQNSHVGAVCRRFIEDFDFNSYSGNTTENSKVWVTMFVYRVNSDGSTTGVTFTEQINLPALLEADINGMEYR